MGPGTLLVAVTPGTFYCQDRGLLQAEWCVEPLLHRCSYCCGTDFCYYYHCYRSPFWPVLPVGGAVRTNRAMEVPEVRCWLDVPSSIVAWGPGKNWGRASVAYVRIQGIDLDAGSATAALLDPCFPCSLGSCSNPRLLVDLGIQMNIVGHAVNSLQQGGCYVIYGAVAPVQHGKFCYEISVPTISARAGVARVLGASLPADPPSGSFGLGELFCGGMGGWSVAAAHCNCFHRAFALDIDPDATTWYARNHGGVLISPCDCATAGAQYQNNVPVITGDMRDWQWMQVLLHVPCEILSASFPCIAFSGMGNMRGTAAEAGRILLDTIQAARLLQPVAVVFENVPGFRNGQEFAQFKECLRLSGFELMFSGMWDIAELGCISRKRWVACALNTWHLSRPQHVGKWAPPLVKRDIKFDPNVHTITTWDQQQYDGLIVSQEEMQLLRKLPNVDGSYGFSGRVYGLGSVLPTFTASYRKSLGFSEAYLRDRGLFAWIVREAKQILRWLSSAEAAVLMGFPLDFQLPSDEEVSTCLVGNCIAPAHAGSTLHYLQQVFTEQLGYPAPEKFEGFLVKLEAACEGLASAVPCIAGDTLRLVRGSQAPPAVLDVWLSNDVLHAAGHTLKPPYHSTDAPSAAAAGRWSTLALCPGDTLKPVQSAEAPVAFLDSSVSTISLKRKHDAQGAAGSTPLQVQSEATQPDETLATAPFPGLVEGEPMSTGQSGVFDVRGQFFRLPDVQHPTGWRHWYRGTFPYSYLDSVVMTYRGEVLRETDTLQPGFRYVLQMATVFQGEDASALIVDTLMCSASFIPCLRRSRMSLGWTGFILLALLIVIGSGSRLTANQSLAVTFLRQTEATLFDSATGKGEVARKLELNLRNT